MNRVFWVRHGPTHEKTFVGHRDVAADLTDIAQITRVAGYIPPNAKVIASDLVRASATADAIGGTRHRLTDRATLREFDFGVWDGMKFDDVAARDPDLSRLFWEAPGDIKAPQGESWNMVAARVTAAIDDILETHPGHDIVAVAHIGVIMTQIARAANCTPYKAMSHHIDNLSVTDMMVKDGQWTLGTVNHIP